MCVQTETDKTRKVAFWTLASVHSDSLFQHTSWQMPGLTEHQSCGWNVGWKSQFPKLLPQNNTTEGRCRKIRSWESRVFRAWDIRDGASGVATQRKRKQWEQRKGRETAQGRGIYMWWEQKWHILTADRMGPMLGHALPMGKPRHLGPKKGIGASEWILQCLREFWGLHLCRWETVASKWQEKQQKNHYNFSA